MSFPIKTFADLPAGEWFIFLVSYRDDVPISTAFIKRDDRTAEAEMGSHLGKVRVMPDALVAVYPRAKVGI